MPASTTWCSPRGCELLDGDLEQCRIQNDALAELVLAEARISAFGAVPLARPRARRSRELREVDGRRACCRASRCRPASAARYLGDERFAPFWAAAEETGAIVFVHPTTRGFDDPVFGDFYLWNTVGNPFETTIAAAHMVMAGVLERHPGLRVILAHGGGALPALRGRLRHAIVPSRRRARACARTPRRRCARFYFDTVTHDPDVLRALVDFAGGDHVLLGTDHPFDMADPAPGGDRARGRPRRRTPSARCSAARAMRLLERRVRT